MSSRLTAVAPTSTIMIMVVTCLGEDVVFSGRVETMLHERGNNNTPSPTTTSNSIFCLLV